jgi:ribosomal protein L32
MPTIHQVRCPNCGSYAERHHLTSRQLIRTQCASCDYLMITCSATGKVIEAYAPGLPMPPVKAFTLSR